MIEQNRNISADHDKKTVPLGAFICENGQTLENVDVHFETWGKLYDRGDNVILICHALTGTSHAASGALDPSPGWWEFFIGPGKPIDTDRYFVICANSMGGCSGSTGPASINPQTGNPYGVRFPMITIRDMIRVQKRLLDRLGIRRLHCVTGASMGGMQALEWAANYPGFVDAIIPMATPGRAYPQSIAFRKAQRKAIMLDPDWRDGDYYGKSIPKRGLELARMMGFISYRSEREFAQRFGRNFVDAKYLSLHGRFEIEQYLEYHGQKLAEWFDANTYLYLSKSMDLHDLGRDSASYEAGVRRIQCPVQMIGFDSDQLFPCHQQREIAELLKPVNPRAHYYEIKTLYGHDAFLIEKEAISKIVSNFLAKLSHKTEGKKYVA